jgi:hypothetical protein
MTDSIAIIISTNIPGGILEYSKSECDGYPNPAFFLEKGEEVSDVDVETLVSRAVIARDKLTLSLEELKKFTTLVEEKRDLLADDLRTCRNC